MKYLYILLILSLSTITHAQIDFKFFEVNDKSEAKALVQLQIDTIEVNDDLVLRHYENTILINIILIKSLKMDILS